ncbi:MAG: nuclear transport factor 2 family protein [Pseudonocardia sediminis]
MSTATDTPTVVETYLSTPKEAAAPLVGELFTADAVVHDEGRTHVGADAIRAWTTGVASAFTFTRTVTEVLRRGDAVVASVHLDGDFPGSPVDLHHHFTVSGGRIAALTICP